MTPTPQTPTEETPATDEELRRRAAECLADHLESGTTLIERCEYLSLQAKGDRTKPIFAASRLMQANARVAEALAKVAQVEQRSRRIVERVQTPTPLLKDSNSIFDGAACDALMMKMLRYMTLVAEEGLDPELEKATGKDKSRERTQENSAATHETGAIPA